MNLVVLSRQLGLYVVSIRIYSCGVSFWFTNSQSGLKPALLGATIFYGIGSATCAIAPNMEIMLGGRLLQGLGGGGLVALTYVAVNRLFPSHLCLV